MASPSNKFVAIESSSCSSGSFDEDEDASMSSSTSLSSFSETLVADSIRAKLVKRAKEISSSGASAMHPPAGVTQQVQQSASELQQVQANNSNKAYKNSPFGLTNHYLTLPESSSNEPSAKSTIAYNNNKHKAAKADENYLESDDDGEEDEEEDTFESSKHDKKAEATRKNFARASDTSDETISDEPHSLNSNQVQDWREMRRQIKKQNHRNAQKSDPSSKRTQMSPQTSQPHRLSPILAQSGGRIVPANDAGLDAKVCNAKHSATLSSHSNQYCVDDDCYLSSSCTSNIGDLRGRRKADKLSATTKAEHLGENDGTLLPKSACDSLLVKFSSIMYATFLVILGCILHVSELRQKSKNSSDHIYTIVVALIGIMWLLFLQTDLQRYKRYASKYIFIESLFRNGGSESLGGKIYKQSKHSESNAVPTGRRKIAPVIDTTNATDPSARSTTSSTASLVNDRLSLNTEVIFKKTAYKMYQQRAAMDQLNSKVAPSNQRYRNKLVAASEQSGVQPLPNGYHRNQLSPTTFAPKHFSSSSTLSGSIAALNKSHLKSKENLVPAYKFLHGKMGANFYLKCGMAAFCFGHVIHEGLRFGQQLYFFGTGNVNCRDSAALVAHLITPLYSFYQLFMMFKYSNLVINRHKVLARFGLMHIIGTSVTFWFRTILEEAFEDFVHKMDYFKTNKLHQFNTSQETLIHPNLAAFFVSVASPIKSLTDPMVGDSTNIAALNATANLNNTISNRNLTLAQSLVALMSSPLSATITPQIVRHIPDSYACAQNTLLTTKSMNALPYLYPFTIEYNLLLAATFLSLYFNVGKVGPHGVGVVCRPALSSHTRYYSKPPRSQSKSPQRSSNLSASHFESSDNDRSQNMIVEWEENDSSRSRNGERDLGEYKSNFVVNADCHSANKGLFCGFFVLLVTLVTIVIFFVTINKPTHIQLGIKINLIQETTLTTLILVVTLVAFRQIVKLNRNTHLKDKVTTDDVLMLIPLPFFFIHSLLSFRAETASIYTYNPLSFGGAGETLTSVETTSSVSSSSSPAAPVAVPSVLQRTQFNAGGSGGTSSSINNNSMINIGLRNSSIRNFAVPIIDTSSGNNNNSHIDHFKLITVALNIIVMIEVLVQTNFIIDGLRRCSESRYMRFKKPGRELITFAILLNITYWIVATFETKSVEQYKTEIEYYGPLPYMFISHTTLPVMLFYRYHSSVCLAEIWNRAYKPPKKG